eukprot:GHVN01064370.1.p1 GENE.GHVN01064370.1~~GHVN01064370.1.p1  ORF type:complete len:1342 (+),score=309.80 GHVN01064370.1:39-4064(+)
MALHIEDGEIIEVPDSPIDTIDPELNATVAPAIPRRMYASPQWSRLRMAACEPPQDDDDGWGEQLQPPTSNPSHLPEVSDVDDGWGEPSSPQPPDLNQSRALEQSQIHQSSETPFNPTSTFKAPSPLSAPLHASQSPHLPPSASISAPADDWGEFDEDWQCKPTATTALPHQSSSPPTSTQTMITERDSDSSVPSNTQSHTSSPHQPPNQINSGNAQSPFCTSSSTSQQRTQLESVHVSDRSCSTGNFNRVEPLNKQLNDDWGEFDDDWRGELPPATPAPTSASALNTTQSSQIPESHSPALISTPTPFTPPNKSPHRQYQDDAPQAPKRDPQGDSTFLADRREPLFPSPPHCIYPSSAKLPDSPPHRDHSLQPPDKTTRWHSPSFKKPLSPQPPPPPYPPQHNFTRPRPMPPRPPQPPMPPQGGGWLCYPFTHAVIDISSSDDEGSSSKRRRTAPPGTDGGMGRSFARNQGDWNHSCRRTASLDLLASSGVSHQDPSGGGCGDWSEFDDDWGGAATSFPKSSNINASHSNSPNSTNRQQSAQSNATPMEVNKAHLLHQMPINPPHPPHHAPVSAAAGGGDDWSEFDEDWMGGKAASRVGGARVLQRGSPYAPQRLVPQTPSISCASPVFNLVPAPPSASAPARGDDWSEFDGDWTGGGQVAALQQPVPSVPHSEGHVSQVRGIVDTQPAPPLHRHEEGLVTHTSSLNASPITLSSAIAPPARKPAPAQYPAAVPTGGNDWSEFDDDWNAGSQVPTPQASASLPRSKNVASAMSGRKMAATVDNHQPLLPLEQRPTPHTKSNDPSPLTSLAPYHAIAGIPPTRMRPSATCFSPVLNELSAPTPAAVTPGGDDWSEFDDDWNAGSQVPTPQASASLPHSTSVASAMSGLKMAETVDHHQPLLPLAQRPSSHTKSNDASPLTSLAPDHAMAGIPPTQMRPSATCFSPVLNELSAPTPAAVTPGGDDWSEFDDDWNAGSQVPTPQAISPGFNSLPPAASAVSAPGDDWNDYEDDWNRGPALAKPRSPVSSLQPPNELINVTKVQTVQPSGPQPTDERLLEIESDPVEPSFVTIDSDEDTNEDVLSQRHPSSSAVLSRQSPMRILSFPPRNNAMPPPSASEPHSERPFAMGHPSPNSTVSPARENRPQRQGDPAPTGGDDWSEFDDDWNVGRVLVRLETPVSSLQPPGPPSPDEPLYEIEDDPVEPSTGTISGDEGAHPPSASASLPVEANAIQIDGDPPDEDPPVIHPLNHIQPCGHDLDSPPKQKSVVYASPLWPESATRNRQEIQAHFHSPQTTTIDISAQQRNQTQSNAVLPQDNQRMVNDDNWGEFDDAWHVRWVRLTVG